MVAQADHAQPRSALLIATSDYNDPALRQLRAPGRDASELAKVLSSPHIGGFTVQTLINARCSELLEAIEDFCADRRLDDQLLIYLSCHGVLDDRGRLYYATTDTRRQRTAATAVAAAWLNERLEDCRARSQIVILDCCHSGAFASDTKGESDLVLEQRFKPHGRGRIVLTASRGTEYSFEGDQPSGAGMQSVFTRAIVDGLRTGDADRDKDGLITVADIYHYAYDRVQAVEPRQTPELWTYGAEGDVLLAYSVRGAIVEPIPLPEDLRQAIESPRPRIRETAVAELAELLDTARPGLVMSARQALQQISDEDIPRVAAVARMALEASQGTAAHEVRQELAERDQRARLRLEAEQAARQKAEEQAGLEAEQAARQKAEEQAGLEAEQAARQKAEEQAGLEAEQAARQKAEEQAGLEAEQAARQKAEEQAGLEAEQAARQKAEEQAGLEAEQAARQKAEEQAGLEAEQAARQKAEEQAGLEAEQAARQKAEEQAGWNATDKVNGFERALVSLAYLLPIVALIAAFRRNSFIRVNAIQALMLVTIGSVITFFTIGPSYHDDSHGHLVPISQPWFDILNVVGGTALGVSVILILYCLFRVACQGRLPKIVLLTRLASKLAALVSRGPHRSTPGASGHHNPQTQDH